MARKTSGLGRGLGDLLEDNTPEIRSNRGSVLRKEEEKKAESTRTPISTPVSDPTSNLYGNTPVKSLYEERHKNKSLKANFKNFNR